MAAVFQNALVASMTTNAGCGKAIKGSPNWLAPRLIIGKTAGLALGQPMHIEPVLGYIDPDKRTVFTHGFTRSCLAKIRARAQATARITAKQETAIKLRVGFDQDTIDLPLPRPLAK